MKKIPVRISLIFWVIFFVFGCKTSDTATTQMDNREGEAPDSVEHDSMPMWENLPESQNKIYRAEETKLFDLIHTKLDVRFDWENHYLNGTATLELSPYFYPQSILTLDAKGFDILSVSLLDGNREKVLTYEYDGEQLSIDLGKPYTRDEHLFVKIKYVAKPDELKAGGSEAITQDKGLYFIEPGALNPYMPRQIWTQGETEASSCWFPTIDAPNQKTTQEIYITVDDAFKTLSNGVLVYTRKNKDNTRTDYWKLDKPHAPYLFMMAIGDFAVVEDEWKGLPVNYYVEPEYRQYAKDIFGNTPEMMSFFSDKLDYKFPWPKYSQVVVREYVSGAMENTTASTFMEEVQVDRRYLQDENWDGIIAHELFHQWFGDLVTCESWSNLPLNEAFANYSEYLWEEYKKGEQAADYLALKETASYFSEAEDKKVDLIRFYYEDREDMFDNHSYAKGGRILHMLRSYVGDDAFFAALSLYLKENEYSTAEVHQLRLAFEQVTGEDLNWFFNQWFLNSGHPQLKVTTDYKNDSLYFTVDQVQDLNNTPLYKIPTSIEYWKAGRRTYEEVVIQAKPSNTFKFASKDAPDLVVLDPGRNLLAEVGFEKSLDQYELQYKKYDNLIVRFHALNAVQDSTNSTVHEMFKNALDDSHWAIRQHALGYIGEHFEEISNSEQLIKKIEYIALNDESGIVRADAIVLLSELKPGVYSSLFENQLNDSSYYVQGASIYAYSQLYPNEAMSTVEKYESANNTNVLIPIANYYVEKGATQKANWFEEKIKKSNKLNRYYLLQLYGQLLLTAPAPVQSSGAEFISMYAKADPTYYVRLSAFQSLMLLSDVPGVESEIIQIKEQEKDERLKQLYKSM